MRRILWAAACLAGALCAPAGATTIISTASFWDGAYAVDYFGGNASSELLGQTITVPTNGDDVLTSFTFTLQDNNGGSISFAGEVRPWDAVNGVASGGPIFSAPSMTQVTSVPTFDDYTFTPNLTLTAGASYLLDFLAQTTTNPEPFAFINPSEGDTYAGGQYVYGSGSIPWYDSTGDLVFTAVFDSSATPTVPEPAPLGLLAFAFIVCKWSRR